MHIVKIISKFRETWTTFMIFQIFLLHMLRLFSTQTRQFLCQIEHQKEKHSHNVCRHHVRQTRYRVFRVIKSYLFNLCFVKTHFHLIIIENFFQIYFQFKKSTIKRVFNVCASCVYKLWFWNNKKKLNWLKDWSNWKQNNRHLHSSNICRI